MLRVCDAERRHVCAVCTVRARATPGARAATPRALVAAAATTNRRWFFLENGTARCGGGWDGRNRRRRGVAGRGVKMTKSGKF
jgi:hypothetical protein